MGREALPGFYPAAVNGRPRVSPSPDPPYNSIQLLIGPAMAALAVTFHVETISTFTSFDSANASEPKTTIDGQLTLDTASGYRRLIATDDRGNALDMSLLTLVYPRAETTREALAAMVAEFPGDLIVGITPEG